MTPVYFKEALAFQSLNRLSNDMITRLAHVSKQELSNWLGGLEHSLSVESISAIQNLIGFNDEGAPRTDIVHFWQIQETWKSSLKDVAYQHLISLAESYGPVSVAHVSRSSDGASTSVFALQFPEFLAILEIKASLIKALTFNPEKIPNMSWLPGLNNIELPDELFDSLEPGAISLQTLKETLSKEEESRKWRILQESLTQKGIKAADLLDALTLKSNSDLTSEVELLLSKTSTSEISTTTLRDVSHKDVALKPLKSSVAERTRRSLGCNPPRGVVGASVAIPESSDAAQALQEANVTNETLQEAFLAKDSIAQRTPAPIFVNIKVPALAGF